MTTQLFFRTGADTTTADQFSLGTNAAKMDTTTSGWIQGLPLRTTRGSGLLEYSANTVAGPTSGIEVTTSSLPVQWVSAPLDADVTISGTITFNLWAREANMADNVAINCAIDRIDSTGAIASRVVTTARVTEVAQTTAAVNNFTATPTSTAFNKGDRIRIRVFGDDAGTMGAGGSFNFGFAGPTAAANGDSYVTFTETFGFLTTDPTTTTIYPTTTVSDIDPGGAGTDTKEAWTSRGSGITTAKRTSVAGWTAPLQTKVTEAGNLVEWYTKPLTAFTLSAPVLAHLSSTEDAARAANASIRAELAICATDGTSAVVWAGTTHPSEMNIDTAVFDSMYLAGADTAVTDGQRLRLRVFFDDTSTAAMAVTSADQLFFRYAGTSAGVNGDSYLIFGQTLTEYVAAGTKSPPFSQASRRQRALLIR